MKKISLFTGILIAIAFPFASLAQVTIAPTNLFIDGNARFGTYMVINGSNETQEISIDFIFNYSQNDDAGERQVVEDNEEVATQYSIAEYVRAFPRNFTIAPGQRQVVRLRLSPPNDLPDGMYWARIKTASSPETPPLELQANDAVSARVAITVEQITGLFFKKGDLETGIEVLDMQPTSSEDNQTLTVLTSYARTGNSPFLGSITASLVNSGGQVVKNDFVSTSLYFDGALKHEFDISDLPSGTYTVRVMFESQRADIAAGDLVQMQPVSQTSTFTKR